MRPALLLLLAGCDVEGLHIEPSAPTSADDLHARVERGAVPRVVWLRDGEPTDWTEPVLPARHTRRGERWAVRPAGWPGPRIEVTIANAPPHIALTSPEGPVPTGRRLVLDVEVTDADDDPVAVTWTWTGPDGSRRAADGPVLPAAALVQGDRWRLDVHADDGRDTAQATVLVEVGNGPPVVRGARLRPAPLTAAAPARVTFEAVDPDGDPFQVEVAWEVDGQEVQRGPDTTLDRALARGERVVAELIADDGAGTTRVRLEEVVENAPPTAAEVAIDPPAPDATSTLTCQFQAFDADGDPVTSHVSWTVNGVAVGAGPTLSGAFARGDVVACAVLPDDDRDLGISVTSAPVTIGNAPPTWADLRVLPTPATRATPLRVSVTGLVDPDGDALSARIRWTVDGVDAGASEQLPPERFHRGAVVEVSAALHDGHTWGPEARASVVVDDAPPAVLGVALDRPVVVPGEPVRATVTHVDPDGDPVTASWRWRLGGALQAASGDVYLVPGDAPVGAEVVAEVRVEALGQSSSWATSPAAVVADPAEARAVRVTPARPFHREDLVCAPWGGEVAPTLAWTVDGAPVPHHHLRSAALPGDTVPWQRTAAGETWRCTATWADGPARADEVTVRLGPPGGNVLIVVADDVGVDKVGRYGLHPSPPPTPTLDALADEGVLFRNAFAYPSCSPTRAALLTGRYGRATGMGRTVVPGRDAFVLSPLEVGLGELVRYSTAYTYATSAVGKWHLGSYVHPNGLLHPRDLGFDWFAVSMANPGSGLLDTGGVPAGYFLWEKNVGGELSLSTAYMTTDQVDDALARIEAMPEPWLLYLAFNAPHAPLHVPPAHLHTSGVGPQASAPRKYDAMLEALDTELGRLLDGMDPAVRDDTTIVFVGDNGTPGHATTAPFLPGRAKTTLYEGGVRVPLIVVGPHVTTPGAEVDALVHVVDVLPTVAEIAGVPLDEVYGPPTGTGALVPWPVHGESLLPFLDEPGRPGRDVVFTEKFAPNGGAAPWDFGGVALRDARWRYLVDVDGVPSLHDLAAQGFVHDGPDLLASPPLSPEAAAAHARLALRLDEILLELDATP